MQLKWGFDSVAGYRYYVSSTVKLELLVTCPRRRREILGRGQLRCLRRTFLSIPSMVTMWMDSHGEFHRFDGPAVTWSNGETWWMNHGTGLPVPEAIGTAPVKAP